MSDERRKRLNYSLKGKIRREKTEKKERHLRVIERAKLESRRLRKSVR